MYLGKQHTKKCYYTFVARAGDGRRTPHVNFVPENFRRPVEGGAAAVAGPGCGPSLRVPC